MQIRILSLIFFLLGFLIFTTNSVYAQVELNEESTTDFNIVSDKIVNKDIEGRDTIKPQDKHGEKVAALESSLNDRTFNLPVGTYVYLKFPEGVENVKISPSKGIIENAPGKYYLPQNVDGVLKVVGKGTASISITKKKRLYNSAYVTGNWAGYVKTTNGPFSNVTSVWTVPASLGCILGDTYASAWIGIDGFFNGDLIQIGTESSCISGSPAYKAWWEILPAATTNIPDTVSAGDTMSAEIKKNSTNWTLTLKNLSRGWTFSTNQAYSGPQNSAEWIMEAPTIGGTQATLTDYDHVTFMNNTVNTINPTHSYNTESVNMINNGITFSTPSFPNRNLNAFNIAYGSVQLASPSGSWTNTNTSNYSKSSSISTLLPSGKVLVHGGQTAAGISVATAEIYNPVTKTRSTT